jgi:hypothetical protein
MARDIVRRPKGVVICVTVISLHLSKGKRNLFTESVRKTLDYDSRKWESLIATSLRGSRFRSLGSGAFSFATSAFLPFPALDDIHHTTVPGGW